MENPSPFQVACGFLERVEFDGHFGAFFEQDDFWLSVDPDWVEPDRLEVRVQLVQEKIRWDGLAVAIHPKDAMDLWIFRRFDVRGHAFFESLPPGQFQAVGVTAFGALRPEEDHGNSECGRIMVDRVGSRFIASTRAQELINARLIVLPDSGTQLCHPNYTGEFQRVEEWGEVKIDFPRLAAANRESFAFFALLPET